MLYKCLKRIVLLLFAPHISQSSCSIITKLPLPLRAHQLGYGKDTNIIYLFGGKTTDEQYINSIYKWNVTAPMTFTPLSVITPTSQFLSWSGNNVFSMNDNIYFIGTATGDWIPDIYIFDAINETWKDNTNIAIPSQHGIYGCLTANATHLFSIGGAMSYSSKDFLDLLQIYDINKNKWFDEQIDIAPIKDKGWCNGYCAFVNHYLYIFGGDDCTFDKPTTINHILKWNPAEKWSNIGYLPYAQSYGIAVHNDDSIYLIGGYTAMGTVSSIYEFDVNTDTITNIYNMTQSLSDITAGIINNKLYIFGGWHSETINAIDDVQICDIIKNPTTANPTTDHPTTDHTTTDNPTTDHPIVNTTTSRTISPNNDQTQSRTNTVTTEFDDADSKDNSNGKKLIKLAMYYIIGVAASCCFCVVTLLYYWRTEKKKGRKNEGIVKQSDEKKENDNVKISDKNMMGNKVMDIGRAARVELDDDSSEVDDLFGVMPEQEVAATSKGEQEENAETGKGKGDGDMLDSMPKQEVKATSMKKQEANAETGEGKLGECTDCSQYKMGMVYDGDGLFYCVECWQDYDDEANRQRDAWNGVPTHKNNP